MSVEKQKVIALKKMANEVCFVVDSFEISLMLVTGIVEFICSSILNNQKYRLRVLIVHR